MIALHQGTVEEAGGLPLGQSTGKDGQQFQAQYVMHILYLSRCEDTIFAIQFTGLPITTTMLANG